MAPMSKITALKLVYLNTNPEVFTRLEGTKMAEYKNMAQQKIGIKKTLDAAGIYNPEMKEYIEKYHNDIDLSEYRMIENVSDIIFDIDDGKKDEKIKEKLYGIAMAYSKQFEPEEVGEEEEEEELNAKVTDYVIDKEEEEKNKRKKEKEKELKNIDSYLKYNDDIVQGLKNKGYDQDMIDYILEMSKGYDEENIKELIFKINESEDIINLSELFTETNPSSLLDPLPASGVSASVPGASIFPDDVKEPETNENVPLNIGSGSTVYPYIERYHPMSILLYFNNSSRPEWDLTLEKNVLSLNITSKERTEIMDDILMEYGAKMFISKRKSDTLKELNELIQLQFCIMRNLHIGSRSKTATVKLDDLVRIDKLASGGGNLAPNTGVPVTPILPNAPIITSGGEVVQTKKEFDFIRDYDALVRKQTLGDSLLINKEQIINKTGEDAHTFGILPGNNLHAAQTTRIKKG